MFSMEKMEFYECWKSSSVGYSGTIIIYFNIYMLGPLSLELGNSSYLLYVGATSFIGLSTCNHILAGVG